MCVYTVSCFYTPVLFWWEGATRFPKIRVLYSLLSRHHVHQKLLSIFKGQPMSFVHVKWCHSCGWCLVQVNCLCYLLRLDMCFIFRQFPELEKERWAINYFTAKIVHCIFHFINDANSLHTNKFMFLLICKYTCTCVSNCARLILIIYVVIFFVSLRI